MSDKDRKKDEEDGAKITVNLVVDTFKWSLFDRRAISREVMGEIDADEGGGGHVSKVPTANIEC
jgi:hypothetical protein